MGTIIIFVIIIAVLGALIGGDSFGEAIREGCGCISAIIIILIILGIYILTS